MLRLVKIVVGIAVVLGCAYFVYYVAQQRRFKSALDQANAAYEMAETQLEVAKAKAGYQELLSRVRSRTQERMVEASIASCEATIALLDTVAQGGVEKYEKLLPLMKRAHDLTGDPTGAWAARIADYDDRLKKALGPTAEEMRAQFAGLAAMPFDKAQRELEFLYLWRHRWKDEGRFQGDQEREAVFDQVHKYLRDGYCRRFEENVAIAQRPEASLAQKAVVLGDLDQVKRFDEAAASGYAGKFAKELEEARKAAAELGRRASGPG